MRKLTYARLYLIEFVDMFQNYVDGALNPYITSTFDKHGLLTVGSVMSTALGGCIPLATAKAIDIWGRVEGFAFMLLLTLIGMIMKAACKNMETYIAAHVLYWTGHVGIIYVVNVMCADITTLKNRMIIFGINETPRIVATFTAPRVAAAFYRHVNFRWAFGAFAIILAACCMPAMGLMVSMYRKARKAGLARKQRSGRNIAQSLAYYFIQFDSTFHAPHAATSLIVFSSLRYPAPHVCLLPLHAPIHARELRPERLEDRLHHSHDGARHSPLSNLCALRTLHGARPISSLEIPQGTHHRRLLPSLRRHVPVRHVLERILRVLPTSRPPAVHRKRQLRPQLVFPHIVGLRSDHRSTNQLDG